MLERIINPPSQSFFLLGPRGTGKSTWLQALFPNAHVIDLLSENTYQGLLANPGLFANQLRAVPPGKWVIIDEVQRLPALLNDVHRFIEKKHLILHRRKNLPYHPNGMSFSALDAAGNLLKSALYYSVGGGFIVSSRGGGSL